MLPLVNRAGKAISVQSALRGSLHGPCGPPRAHVSNLAADIYFFVLLLGSLRKCWCQVMGCLDHVRGHVDQVHVTGQTRERSGWRGREDWPSSQQQQVAACL